MVVDSFLAQFVELIGVGALFGCWTTQLAALTAALETTPRCRRLGALGKQNFSSVMEAMEYVRMVLGLHLNWQPWARPVRWSNDSVHGASRLRTSMQRDAT